MYKNVTIKKNISSKMKTVISQGVSYISSYEPSGCFRFATNILNKNV